MNFPYVLSDLALFIIPVDFCPGLAKSASEEALGVVVIKNLKQKSKLNLVNCICSFYMLTLLNLFKFQVVQLLVFLVKVDILFQSILLASVDHSYKLLFLFQLFVPMFLH